MTATPRLNGRMTVAQVLLNLSRGGMEAMAVSLACALDRARFRPVLIALDAGGEHEAVLGRTGIEYHVLGGRRFWDPGFHWALARLLRRVGAWVVHTHHFAPLLHSLPAVKLARVRRLVHTEHAYQYLEPRADYRRLLRWMSRWTDAFVVVGGTLEPYYRDEVGVSARRLCVIRNGVALDRYQPAADPVRARRALGLAGSGFVVGTAGRFFPEKDFAVLLRAIAGVRGRGVDASLVMIGDGPERPALERLARDLGIRDRVSFLGWRDDVERLVPALDVFALTSASEGLPLVVLEAMAAAVPVVTTPVGDLREIVVDGRTGRVFAVGDAAALTAILVELAADPARRRAMGAAGRLAVGQRYSVEAMVAGYERLYDA